MPPEEPSWVDPNILQFNMMANENNTLKVLAWSGEIPDDLENGFAIMLHCSMAHLDLETVEKNHSPV